MNKVLQLDSYIVVIINICVFNWSTRFLAKSKQNTSVSVKICNNFTIQEMYRNKNSI